MVCPPLLRPARARPSLLLASLLCCARLASAAEPFAFTVEPDTLRADERGAWAFSVRLENRSDRGLYPDSLFVDWVNEDPAEPGAPRQGTNPLSGLARAMRPASAGGDMGCSISMPSEFARGRLTVRLLVHGARDRAFVARHDVVVAGSVIDDRFPSTKLDAGGRAAEVVLMRADSSAWPAPGIVLLPAAGVRARSLLRWGLGMRDRGYSVALLGPPGAGASQGPGDHAGPASVAAVHAALARVGADPGFDARRLVLWGRNLGGTTVLLAAVRHPELAGVIAVDACFDPWAEYRALDEQARAAFVQAAGRDSAGWRARSPLAQAARITAPVLVVETDAASPAAGAAAFALARAGRTLSTEARIHGQEAHPVLERDAHRVAMDFLGRRTHESRP